MYYQQEEKIGVFDFSTMDQEWNSIAINGKKKSYVSCTQNIFLPPVLLNFQIDTTKNYMGEENRGS